MSTAWERPPEYDDEPDCMCGDNECPQCNKSCHYCGGDGCGAYGDDWDNPNPLWYKDGEIIDCPCCHGSGLAKDCTFW